MINTLHIHHTSLTCRHQSAIDAIVHEIAQKTLEKHQQGEASKVTNALANKIKALHGKLRTSLEELYAWMAAADDDPQADVKLSESVVSDMLLGYPAPWHVGSQSYGLRLMLGRRFTWLIMIGRGVKSSLLSCQERRRGWCSGLMLCGSEFRSVLML